ncbi:hypothetical protein PoB_005985300 [Plakobranchus ocellatus]|uniref:Uncharacterized protein n=1 Tax=Plakobranchus ocellatus TaxID=259542 RepID=A0AAV4CMV0_9GAST|nr:hypothetical protein PoB_005985300 [Plakobranchus ocellatus]
MRPLFPGLSVLENLLTFWHEWGYKKIPEKRELSQVLRSGLHGGHDIRVGEITDTRWIYLSRKVSLSSQGLLWPPTLRDYSGAQLSELTLAPSSQKVTLALSSQSLLWRPALRMLLWPSALRACSGAQLSELALAPSSQEVTLSPVLSESDESF